MSLTWPQWPEITLWPLQAGPTVRVAGSHTVPHAAAAAADDVWTRMTAANPRLFDGPILSLADFDPQTGEIVCRRSSYKWLAVQDRLETGVILVAVNGVVTAGDAGGREHILLARRSPDTWKYGGMWELCPAGGLEPPLDDGAVPLETVVQQLRHELREEAGIDDPLTDAHPIGFYCDAAARSFNIILRGRLSRPLEEIITATRSTHWDTDDTRWVSEAALPPFLAEHTVLHACGAILSWLLTGNRAQTSSGNSRSPTG